MSELFPTVSGQSAETTHPHPIRNSNDRNDHEGARQEALVRHYPRGGSDRDISERAASQSGGSDAGGRTSGLPDLRSAGEEAIGSAVRGSGLTFPKHTYLTPGDPEWTPQQFADNNRKFLESQKYEEAVRASDYSDGYVSGVILMGCLWIIYEALKALWNARVFLLLAAVAVHLPTSQPVVYAPHVVPVVLPKPDAPKPLSKPVQVKLGGAR